MLQERNAERRGTVPYRIKAAREEYRKLKPTLTARERERGAKEEETERGEKERLACCRSVMWSPRSEAEAEAEAESGWLLD